MSHAKPEFDVIIIGGGPGGISAALWADDLGLSAILIESAPELGGQLLRTFNPIRNHLGVETSSGVELRNIFERQVRDRRFARKFGTRVDSIDGVNLSVILSSGETISGRAIVFAAGVRRRALGVPGEAGFSGRGIIESGKRDAVSAAGKSVVIVGGGDAAFENAVILSEVAESVTLVHRRDSVSARREFVDAALNHPRVTVRLNSRVMSIDGDRAVESVTIETLLGFEKIAADLVLIRIGVEPNSGLLDGQVRLDKRGYVIVDHTGLTSIPGLYAVGDCACPESPTVSTAVGMGATAAKSIFAWLSESECL